MSRIDVILQRMGEMLNRLAASRRNRRPSLLDMQQAGWAKREHDSLRSLLDSAPRPTLGASASPGHKRCISESDGFSTGGSNDTSPTSSGSSWSPMPSTHRNVRPRSPASEHPQAPPHAFAPIVGPAPPHAGAAAGAANMRRPSRRASTWTEPSASGWDCGNRHCQLRHPDKTERDFARLPDAMLQCRHCHSLCGSAMEDNFTETRVSGSAAEEGKKDLRRADDPHSHARAQRAGLSSEMPDVSRLVASSMARASESALRARAGDVSCADHSSAFNQPAVTLQACKAVHLPEAATRMVIERVAAIFDHIAARIAPRRQSTDSNQREAHGVALEAFHAWTRRVVVADAREHCAQNGGRLDMPTGTRKALARCCPQRVAHFVVEQLVARRIVGYEMQGRPVHAAYFRELERRLQNSGTFLIAGGGGDNDNDIKVRIGRALREIVPCTTVNVSGMPSARRDTGTGTGTYRDQDRFGDGDDEADDEYDE